LLSAVNAALTDRPDCLCQSYAILCFYAAAYPVLIHCLQSFDTVGWAAGRASGLLKKTEWWGAGVVICLEKGADLHMAQLMPLPLTVSCFSKIQIGGIPNWLAVDF